MPNKTQMERFQEVFGEAGSTRRVHPLRGKEGWFVRLRGTGVLVTRSADGAIIRSPKGVEGGQTKPT